MCTDASLPWGGVIARVLKNDMFFEPIPISALYNLVQSA
ncbi:hypothetical protein N480_12040 [Pseudoalteromonas luteoviolacea S2607]|nr:hypothetical protein N480_12040 [Pseudoalteromonas luteoviolacea S2607]